MDDPLLDLRTARYCWKMGDLDKSLEISSAAVSSIMHSHGATDHRLIVAYIVLAVSRLERNAWKEGIYNLSLGESLLRSFPYLETHELVKEPLSHARFLHGCYLYNHQRPDEAAKRFLSVLDMEGSSSADCAMSQLYLGRIARQGENFRSANEWFSKSFMYCKEHLGDKDIRTLQAACHVGALAFSQGNSTLAVEYFSFALPGLEEKLPQDPSLWSLISDACFAVAQSLLQQNATGEARLAALRTLQLRAENMPPTAETALSVAECLSLLTRIEYNAGEFEDAKLYALATLSACGEGETAPGGPILPDISWTSGAAQRCFLGILEANSGENYRSSAWMAAASLRSAVAGEGSLGIGLRLTALWLGLRRSLTDATVNSIRSSSVEGQELHGLPAITWAKLNAEIESSSAPLLSWSSRSVSLLGIALGSLADAVVAMNMFTTGQWIYQAAGTALALHKGRKHPHVIQLFAKSADLKFHQGKAEASLNDFLTLLKELDGELPPGARSIVQQLQTTGMIDTSKVQHASFLETAGLESQLPEDSVMMSLTGLQARVPVSHLEPSSVQAVGEERKEVPPGEGQHASYTTPTLVVTPHKNAERTKEGINTTLSATGRYPSSLFSAPRSPGKATDIATPIRRRRPPAKSSSAKKATPSRRPPGVPSSVSKYLSALKAGHISVVEENFLSEDHVVSRSPYSKSNRPPAHKGFKGSSLPQALPFSALHDSEAKEQEMGSTQSLQNLSEYFQSPLAQIASAPTRSLQQIRFSDGHGDQEVSAVQDQPSEVDMSSSTPLKQIFAELSHSWETTRPRPEEILRNLLTESGGRRRAADSRGASPPRRTTRAGEEDRKGDTSEAFGSPAVRRLEEETKEAQHDSGDNDVAEGVQNLISALEQSRRQQLSPIKERKPAAASNLRTPIKSPGTHQDSIQPSTHNEQWRSTSQRPPEQKTTFMTSPSFGKGTRRVQQPSNDGRASPASTRDALTVLLYASPLSRRTSSSSAKGSGGPGETKVATRLSFADQSWDASNRSSSSEVPRASSQHTSSAIDLSIPFHLTPSGSKRGVPARLWKSEKSKSATMKTGLAARASILSGIGNLLRIQVERGGDSKGALSCYSEALKLYEKACGSDSLNCASMHINIAHIHLAQGQLARSREHYVKATSIRSRALGSDHEDTIQARRYLAEVLIREGKQSQALTELARIHSKLKEMRHPDASQIQKRIQELKRL